MHFYICPYCNPSPSAHLERTKVKEKRCDHKKTLFGKNKECEKNEYKCKEVLRCQSCTTDFAITKGFLKEQKRKIKDG